MADELKLLICDEDTDSRVTMRKTAQRALLEVAGEVGYGIKAVSLALDTRPDVILIAVEEPVGRPLDTAETLANALADTPIVIYSSINSPSAIRRAMVFGARDYIINSRQEPVQADRLGATINAVLVQEEKRQMRRAGQLFAHQGRGTVITVTGGKGGIGKSVISVNLALALKQETGVSVVIFDADTQFGDVATMLDLSPNRTVGDLMAKLGQLDRDNIDDFLTEHAGGVKVLAASDSEVLSYTSSEDLKLIIELLAQNYEYVIVDTAGTFDRFLRACVEASTLTLVVTSGQVSSIRDTTVALRRLESWEIPPDRFKVILNRGVRGDGVDMDSVRQAVNQEIFWEVPYDRRIPEGVQSGQPVVRYNDNSAGARNLISLSRVIAGVKKPLAKPQRMSQFKRLLKKGGPGHDPVATVAVR